MNSFPADRLRPRWGDAVVAALILAAAGLLAWSLRPQSGGELVAVVRLDGAEVARQSLNRAEPGTLLEVEGVAYPITLEFAPGQVRVAHTDCPGGDCAAVGWVSRAGGQIICLPNRLSVSLEGTAGTQLDGISG